MSIQCEVKRWDVDPAHDPWSRQYVQPSCEHAVCLEDIRLHAPGVDHQSIWDCPSGRCALDQNEAQCELDAGHDGAHQWEEVGAPTLGEWVSLPTPRDVVPA